MTAADDNAAQDTALATYLQAQAGDRSTRAALVQQAQAAYQQLQTDITAWPGLTTTQKLDAVLRTMQALALAMQVEAVMARMIQRGGN